MKRPEAVKAVKWFQREVGMAGWRVRLYSGKACPASVAGGMTRKEVNGTYGLAMADVRHREIRIWLNPEGASDKRHDRANSLETLMHELQHGAFREAGIAYAARQEDLTDRLARILADQYRQTEGK